MASNFNGSTKRHSKSERILDQGSNEYYKNLNTKKFKKEYEVLNENKLIYEEVLPTVLPGSDYSSPPIFDVAFTGEDKQLLILKITPTKQNSIMKIYDLQEKRFTLNQEI